MGYTPSFTPQYENGWENLPIEETPITAEALNAYDDAIENIEDYLASDESQANLADAYDETATYEAGDYRIHNGDLYKCLEDIDEPEEWDSTKWESCLITDEMATSGGTTVIANPSGQATETLTKLQVEETIYGISGGGGSANIWEGTQAELEEQFDDIPNETAIIVIDDEEAVDASAEIYSEDERLIGLWTDNKPLYQKTFVTEKTNILANSTIDVTSEIASIDAETIVTYKHKMTYTVSQTTVHGEYWDDSIARFSHDVPNSKYNIILTLGSSTLATLKIVWTIQYTKSTDAPLSGVVAGRSTMYVASSDCYSTEEKEIGVFADGKPLYQKTIYSSGGNLTSGQIIISNDLANIDHVASWKCVTHDTARDRDYCLDHNRLDATEDIRLQVYIAPDDTVALVILVSKTSFLTAIGDTWITLQYTKTTDTAGSGKFTPAGTKTEHYSENEEVIGTWIDGKTLYRKVLTGSLTGSSPYTIETTANLGIDEVINARGYLVNTVSGGGYKMQVPSFVNSTNSSGIYIDANGNIKLYVMGSYNIYNIILEYTKAS